MSLLNQSINVLSGVGDEKAKLIAKELGIQTCEDLIHYFPYRYFDQSTLTPWNELTSAVGKSVLVKGVITSFGYVGNVKYARSSRLEAELVTEEGKHINLCWFQGGKWVERLLHIGQSYVCSGKLGLFKRALQISHPELMTFEAWQKKSSKWQAMYNTTEKLKTRYISSKTIEKIQKQLATLIAKNSIQESLPQFIVEHLSLMSRDECLREIHSPTSLNKLSKAKERLKFEEVFWFQLNLCFSQSEKITKSQGVIFKEVGELFNTFYKRLNIELTNAQKRVIKEIRQNCYQGQVMNRLLQGDVGSGKTLVALMSMLIAVDNGFQACLVAPTEVLAQQHYKSLSEDCFGLPIHLNLLTGSTKQSERNEILDNLKLGSLHILIGTHALFEDKVIFKNLGLVVIDEQHRFGVQQRAKLIFKNQTQPTHTLLMTATPIPRTLALTTYSDLEVSIIDEIPKGRKVIQTVHRWDSQRILAYQFIQKEIDKGRQAYIIFPLIDESEKLQFEDLMTGYEQVKDFFDKEGTSISLVHGRLNKEVKEQNMRRFVEHKTNIMVATTVIEVGVNVPNATVMLIESSQKFGLSQLHQLRGRVGRSQYQSYCILMTSNQLSSEARERINIMVSTNDGFEIAEKDLAIRGPGDIQGTRQSGDLPFKMLNLITDQKIISQSKQLVSSILQKDPTLTDEKHKSLHNILTQKHNQQASWVHIG